MSATQKDGKYGITIGIFIICGLGGFGGFLGEYRHAGKKTHNSQDRNISPHNLIGILDLNLWLVHCTPALLFQARSVPSQ